MLELENIQLELGRTKLLINVNLSLQAGEIMAVIGPNGSGKTSLLRVACGEMDAQEGCVLFGGESIGNIALRDRARRMAMLPQLSSLNFPFSVEEVILLGRSPHGSGAVRDRAIIQEVMAGLDIVHLRHRLYTQLSGGEKQRVQIARVMAQTWGEGKVWGDGKLLLLDEPTSALDLGHQQMLMALLRKLAGQGMGILMAVHDVNLAANHADRILALKDGRALALGPADRVITPKIMEELYDVHLQVIPHPRSGRPMAVAP